MAPYHQWPPAGSQLIAVLQPAQGSIEPQPATEVFQRTPLVITGSYLAGSPATLLLTWTANNQTQTRTVSLAEAIPCDGDTLRLLRGARLITDLEIQAADTEGGRLQKKQAQRIENGLEALSRAYGLVSRAMSLVAVIKRAGDQPGSLPVTQIIPVGLPADSSDSLKYFMAPAPGMAMSCNRTRCSNVKNVFMEVAYQSEPIHADKADPLLELSLAMAVDGGMEGRTLPERILRSLVRLQAY